MNHFVFQCIPGEPVKILTSRLIAALIIGILFAAISVKTMDELGTLIGNSAIGKSTTASIQSTDYEEKIINEEWVLSP
jgi:hypothetical protein